LFEGIRRVFYIPIWLYQTLLVLGNGFPALSTLQVRIDLQQLDKTLWTSLAILVVFIRDWDNPMSSQSSANSPGSAS
jgi:hypothetical protein